jgi:hypothetical protein
VKNGVYIYVKFQRTLRCQEQAAVSLSNAMVTACKGLTDRIAQTNQKKNGFL